MNAKLTLLTTVSMLLLFACSDSKSEIVPPPEPEPKAETLEVSKAEFKEIEAQGDSYQLIVTSNTEWTAEVTTGKEWCTVDTPSGSGNNVIKVTVAPNETFEPREATLTINGKTLKKEVKFQQQAAIFYEALELDREGLLVFEYGGGTLDVKVTANVDWTVHVTDGSDWCTVTPESGSKNGAFTLNIAANENRSNRYATITVTGKELQQELKIKQEENPNSDFTESDAENYHYELPVVFHVFYQNAASATQNVSAERINEIIKSCNDYYADRLGSSSVNMNLEFVLADKDPDGQTLAEPGIHRIKVSNPIIDMDSFMADQNSKQYLWELSKYINICLYQFKQDPGSSGVVLGVAYLPPTLRPDNLPGLSSYPYIPTLENMSYPHCISINNRFINADASVEGTLYNGYDPIVTIAHELGHYVGLHHAFNEKSPCADSDYCNDTPAYDRDAYWSFVSSYTPKNGTKLSMEDYPYLMERTDCPTGVKSTPNNVMDYEYTWANRFTPEQLKRVRYALTHSPVLPGPKLINMTQRRSTGGVPEPPIMVTCPMR